jgi:hypothetical protein
VAVATLDGMPGFEFGDLMEDVFVRYGRRCLPTEIDRPEMLTLAHVQPRSERVDLAEDPTNVLVANWNHHRASTRGNSRSIPTIGSTSLPTSRRVTTGFVER